MPGSADNLSADMITPTFAIVAGEASGDTLGADLIRALKRLFPNAQFEGIGGPKMIAEGFVSHHQMDRLSVMGFVEPFKRLPELLSIRRDIIRRYKQTKPAAFIGIDSPDFTLRIERALHEEGVKTVHYVSPSVWAWRQGRVKKIAKAVDLVLTLVPFEQAFYLKRSIQAICVGHTLADQIPLQPNTEQARAELGLEIPITHQLLAILPGSRAGEVERMLPVFLESAQLCLKQNPQLCFVIPAASEARQQQIKDILQQYPSLPVRVFLKQSHAVMQASDAVVMASGTTTLEAMLLKKPMVIAYKVAALSYFIFARMVKVKFIGLPNLLAQKELAKEFIQQAATAVNIAPQILKILHKDEQAVLQQEYLKLHKMLKLNASEKAAQAVLNLIDQPIKSIH